MIEVEKRKEVLTGLKNISVKSGKHAVSEILKKYNVAKVSLLQEKHLDSVLREIATFGKKHSILSPSGCKQWSNCPASVKVRQLYERESSPFAQEGTNAHELGEYCLINGIRDVLDIDFTKFDFEIPDDMLPAVQIYLDYCFGLIKKHGKNAVHFVELKIGMKPIWNGMYGTADFVLFDKKNKKIIVVDYKHGAGLYVEIKQNYQLLCYAIGAMWQQGDWNGYKTVETVIVQPRTGGDVIRSYTYTMAQIIKYAKSLSRMAKRAMSDEVKFKAGAHCQFCPHATNCETLHSTAVQVMVQMDEDGNVVNVNKLGAQELADLYRMTQGAMREFNKAVFGGMMRMLESGEKVPGYFLVPKKGRRVWADEEKATLAMKKLANEHGKHQGDIQVPGKLKSPAQMEKTLGTHAKLAISEHVVMKKSSGNTIGTNANQAIEVKTIAEKFGKIIDKS